MKHLDRALRLKAREMLAWVDARSSEAQVRVSSLISGAPKAHVDSEHVPLA